jgi:hypothetical protein
MGNIAMTEKFVICVCKTHHVWLRRFDDSEPKTVFRLTGDPSKAQTFDDEARAEHVAKLVGKYSAYPGPVVLPKGSE